MSELIKNREYRQQAVKEILRDLHAGKPVAEVKSRFDAIAKDLDPAELSLIEQSLINEGMPVKEVQRLCDVHAAVFRDALEKNPELAVPPGHPVDIFMDENRALERLIDQETRPVLGKLAAAQGDAEKAAVLELAEKLNLLWDVDKHYRRKEDLVFPFLEKYEITGPPKVMWGVDDKVRGLLKDAKKLAAAYRPEVKRQLIDKTEEAVGQIREMIFKEEKILFPMAVQTLTEDEWYRVQQDSDELGYCLVEPRHIWKPVLSDATGGTEQLADDQARGYIKFGTGVLSPRDIELIFNHLPVDLTFVDKHGVVKYFSAGKERIFPRARTIIGRKVENCHPPASVHIVENLVEDFVSGRKDQEEFWLELGGKYVYIRYFAVKDEAGEFAGVLEVSQDIKPLQAISGEKRIAD
jgi:DUF438 domain-containing protein